VNELPSPYGGLSHPAMARSEQTKVVRRGGGNMSLPVASEIHRPARTRGYAAQLIALRVFRGAPQGLPATFGRASMAHARPYPPPISRPARGPVTSTTPVFLSA
jgi:hypothetical protein